MGEKVMCVACRFSELSPDGKTGMCHRGPPTVFMLIQQAQPVGKLTLAGREANAMTQAQMRFVSSWTPVPIEGWCGEGKPVEDGK